MFIGYIQKLDGVVLLVTYPSTNFISFSIFFVLMPLLHLQYIKIDIEAFSQSCRYGKYLSLFTPVTVFGAEHYRVCHDIKKSKPWRGPMVSRCTLVLSTRIHQKKYFVLLLPSLFLYWTKLFFTLFRAFLPSVRHFTKKQFF